MDSRSGSSSSKSEDETIEEIEISDAPLYKFATAIASFLGTTIPLDIQNAFGLLFEELFANRELQKKEPYLLIILFFTELANTIVKLAKAKKNISAKDIENFETQLKDYLHKKELLKDICDSSFKIIDLLRKKYGSNFKDELSNIASIKTSEENSAMLHKDIEESSTAQSSTAHLKAEDNVGEMQSYILGLPSITEAQKDYTDVTADHIPILAKIPFNQAGIDNILVLTCNVCANGGDFGLAPHPNNTNENSDLTKIRQQTLVAKLKTIVEDNNPDFITLQEVGIPLDPEKQKMDPDFAFYSALMEKIGDKYAVVTNELDVNGKKIQGGVSGGRCITLYRKEKFTPIVKEEDGDCQSNSLAKGNVTKFILSGKEQYEFRIANTHHVFSENITYQEKTLETFLKGKDRASASVDKNKTTLSIMVGDFNGTIPPLTNEPQKTTTSVSSPAIISQTTDDEELKKACKNTASPPQNGWCIDGAFYSTRVPQMEDDQVSCQQASVTYLNPSTGKAYTAEELSAFTEDQLKNLHPLQRKFITQLRLAISIDEKIKKEFSGHEEAIKEILPNPIVRRAVNLNNERGIGVIINEELYNQLLNNNSDVFSLQTINHINVVYAKDNDINKLITALVKLKTYDKELYDYFSVLGDDKFKVEILQDAKKKASYLIYAEEKNIKALRTEIEFAKSHPKLIKLATSICDIPTQEELKDTKAAFINYFTDMRNDKTNNDCDILTDHITELASQVATKATNSTVLSLNEIQTSLDKLNEKLYGKPPLDKKRQALIGGIIGALIGAVIGAIIGAVTTFYLGGAGSILGILVGIFTGYTLGTAAMVSGAGIGGAIGSVIGFFRGHKQDATYNNAKDQKHTEKTLDVLKSKAPRENKSALFATNKPVDKIYDGLTTVAKARVNK